MLDTINKALEGMEAREKAATPGPWPTDSSELADVIGVWVDGSRYHKLHESADVGESEFIGHARQDLPKLIKALRVAVEAMRDNDFHPQCQYFEEIASLLTSEEP